MTIVTNADLVLSLKIKSLLSNQNLRSDEKNLVALILLTTVHSLYVDELVTASLFNFCIRLSRGTEDCFLSAICQVVKQIKQPHEYNWQGILDGLMSSLSSGSVRPETLADRLETIFHCITMDESLQIPSNALHVIWEKVENYTQNFRHEKPTTNRTSEFMIEAIELVLVHFQSNLQARSPVLWMQPFLSILQFLATRNCIAGIPKWYEAMMEHTVSMDASSPEQPAWHYMTFACARSLILLDSENKLRNSRTVQPLIDLITAHLGSSQTDIRKSEVWETCSLLLSHCGRIPNRRTTKSSHLCTWTRLAVGEYRINLEMLCIKDSSSFNETTVEACYQIVEAAFQLVVQEACSIEDGNALSIEPAALLHLRCSFLDALQSTICYLSTPSTTHVIFPCKMLGLLLCEFSAWEDVPEGHTSMEVLGGVAKALSSGEDKMMECLVKLFASAEGNKSCIQQLHRAGLLGSTVTSYFETFWKPQNANKGIHIQTACIAMESWFLIANPSPKQARHLAKLLLGWVETTLEENTKGLDAASSVMAAVGCYGILTGDRLPSENDAIVLEHALLFCKQF